MATLEWKKLLCTKRERESKSGSSINPVRNEFEADYDRIVGSSSVRRLQDKAQDFPLQQNDVARTRLTHSMEVSALARSLGKAVGRRLEEKEIFQDTERLFSAVMEAGFDLHAMPLVMLGGGACIVNRHVSPKDGLCRVIPLLDDRVNAIGFERALGRVQGAVSER